MFFIITVLVHNYIYEEKKKKKSVWGSKGLFDKTEWYSAEWFEALNDTMTLNELGSE